MLPPWRSLLAVALQRGHATPQSRYFQLATIGLDGRPRNRTVVFRGFGPGAELLVLTDARSHKCEELARDPRAEICWYLPDTREQFRIAVEVACIGPDAPPEWAGIRQELWRARGATGQGEWLGAVPDAPVPLAIDAFVLMACTVVAVDHLELLPDPRAHHRHTLRDGRWEVSALS